MCTDNSDYSYYKFIFKGEFTDENRKIIRKKHIALLFLAMIFTFICCSVITIIFALTIRKEIFYFLICLLFFFVVVCAFLPLQKEIVPEEVCFDENTVYITLKNITESRSLTDVIGINQGKSLTDIKVIYDYGEFYYFKFYFPHKTIYCICQKNLLIKGTIEEFEERFSSYIVKK